DESCGIHDSSFSVVRHHTPPAMRTARLQRHMWWSAWAFTPSYVATGVPAQAWHAFCRPYTSRHETTRRMFSRQEPCRAQSVARLFSMARVSGGAPQTVRTARVYSTQEACLRCDGKLQDGCAVVWYGTVLAWCSSVQDRPAGLLHRGAAWRRCQVNRRSGVGAGDPGVACAVRPAGRR